MELNVSVNIDDFIELFDEDTLATLLRDEIKLEVMKLVKKDPKYKAFIAKKALDTLNSLEV